MSRWEGGRLYAGGVRKGDKFLGTKGNREKLTKLGEGTGGTTPTVGGV